jgi:glucose-1-phosphate thymidylyltransferase
VLAGGTGSRLRPITFSMAKQLVPVANKPIIEYGLEDLAEAGITEVGVVIAPESGAEVKEAVGDGSRFGLDVEYIVQEKPLGVAHALKTALPFVHGDDCLMYLGDNLVKDGVRDVVDGFLRLRPNCQIMLSEVENPSSFGVAELGEGGEVVRLVEKPQVPPSNLALVGVYLFDGNIAEAVEAIEPSGRQEYEITDAIQYLIDSGRTVRSSIVRDWWKDTGTKEDLLAAQKLVIAELAHNVHGELADCRMSGAVHIGEGSRLVECEIVGPVVIGEGVQMSRVSVGPQASVGDGCRLSDAAVENSIVMAGAEVHGWKIRDSLVGREAQLRGLAPDGFVEMTLGERSEIVGK